MGGKDVRHDANERESERREGCEGRESFVLLLLLVLVLLVLWEKKKKKKERQDAVGAFRPPTASLGLQVEVKRREERGRGRGREVLRALGTVGVSAAVVTDTVDQVAFRELVTVDS